MSCVLQHVADADLAVDQRGEHRVVLERSPVVRAVVVGVTACAVQLYAAGVCQPRSPSASSTRKPMLVRRGDRTAAASTRWLVDLQSAERRRAARVRAIGELRRRWPRCGPCSRSRESAAPGDRLRARRRGDAVAHRVGVVDLPHVGVAGADLAADRAVEVQHLPTDVAAATCSRSDARVVGGEVAAVGAAVVGGPALGRALARLIVAGRVPAERGLGVAGPLHDRRDRAVIVAVGRQPAARSDVGRR